MKRTILFFILLFNFAPSFRNAHFDVWGNSVCAQPGVEANVIVNDGEKVEYLGGGREMRVSGFDDDGVYYETHYLWNSYNNPPQWDWMSGGPLVKSESERTTISRSESESVSAAPGGCQIWITHEWLEYEDNGQVVPGSDSYSESRVNCPNPEDDGPIGEESDDDDNSGGQSDPPTAINNPQCPGGKVSDACGNCYDPNPSISTQYTQRPRTYYWDGDGDGWGGYTRSCIESPGDGWITQGGDYNDDCFNLANSSAQCPPECPGWGQKDDCGVCVGGTSGKVAKKYYRDADGDGWGYHGLTINCSNPGAGWTTEVGDYNDNCYNVSNDSKQCVAFYRDQDGDGWGAGTAQSLSYNQSGWVERDGDYNDNCYNTANDANQCPQTEYFEDKDGDGWGNSSTSQWANEPITGRITQGGDVNDDCYDLSNDPTQCPKKYFEDLDGDGWGNNATVVLSTTPIEGRIIQGDDVNDSCYNLENDDPQCGSNNCPTQSSYKGGAATVANVNTTGCSIPPKNPCNATSLAAGKKVTELYKNPAFRGRLTELAEGVGNWPEERNFCFQQDAGTGAYSASAIVVGGPANVSQTCSNGVATIHTHPSGNGPSPADLYQLADNGSPNTMFTMGADGITYAIVVTDNAKFDAFRNTYPQSSNIDMQTGNFTVNSSLIAPFTGIRGGLEASDNGYSVGDASAGALGSLLLTYDAGVSVYKLENGKFKALGHTEDTMEVPKKYILRKCE